MRDWIRSLRRDHWKWGKLVASTLRDRDAYVASGIDPVDVEVIPQFTGDPELMEAWLIFASENEAEAAKSRAIELRNATGSILLQAGFPAEAFSSFELRFTSVPEIEAGGGRFLFFR